MSYNDLAALFVIGLAVAYVVIRIGLWKIADKIEDRVSEYFSKSLDEHEAKRKGQKRDMD